MHLQGLDTIAHELAQSQEKNAEYLQQIQALELRLIKAEDKLKNIEAILKSDF